MKDPGIRFENMIACHLIKRVHFLEDTEGRDVELRYFRDNEQREVDFVITEDSRPLLFVECKFTDTTVSTHLRYLKHKFPQVPAYQLTFQSKKDFVTPEGIRVADAHIGLKEIFSLLKG